MNDPSHDPWQQLFEQLPADTSTRPDHQQRLRQQVVDAYDQPAEISTWKNQLKSTGRYLMTHKTPRWVAATAALFIAGWFLATLGSRPAVAMNKMLETILNAKTVRYVVTAHKADDKGGFTMKAKVQFAEPGKLRMEFEGGDALVHDHELGKSFYLSHSTKTARVNDLPNASADARGPLEDGSLTRLRAQILKARKDADSHIESLGEREIDGRVLVGFRFRTPPHPMTVWADPETNQPVLVKIEPAGPDEPTMTLSEFEFNVELDESLFSLEVPVGYERKGKAAYMAKQHQMKIAKAEIARANQIAKAKITKANLNAKAAVAEAALDAAKSPEERFYALNGAAKYAFIAGKAKAAQQHANELLQIVQTRPDNWNSPNAIHDANQVLGRIALANGDVAEAKKRLLASADSEGSPQLNSFGPSMQLAKDLLARGEKEVVLEYFDRCGKFWKSGSERLEAWSKSVNEGRTPDFGANLRF